MKLIKARSLADWREGDDDMAGRASRRARRRLRKARRAERDRDKAAELRQKARSLERGGKKGRRGKKKGKEAETPEAQPRAPGMVPSRVRQQLEDAAEDAPAELEAVSPDEDEPDPEEVFPEDDGELGRSGWGPQSRLGEHLRLSAEEGYRAAVIVLRPGLYLVAEVDEAATRPQLGFVPLLAPLIVRSATRLLHPKAPDQPGQAPQPQPTANPGTALVRRDPASGTTTPAATLGWADPEDVAAVLGCEVCDRRRR